MSQRRRRRPRWLSKLRIFLVKMTVTVMVIAAVIGAFLQWISTLELTDNHVRALWILVAVIFLAIAVVEIRQLIEQRSTPKKATNGGKREKVERFWRDRKPEDMNKHGASFDMGQAADGAYWGHADYWKAAKEAREAEKARQEQQDDPQDEYIGDVGVGRAITKWFERRRGK